MSDNLDLMFSPVCYKLSTQCITSSFHALFRTFCDYQETQAEEEIQSKAEPVCGILIAKIFAKGKWCNLWSCSRNFSQAAIFMGMHNFLCNYSYSVSCHGWFLSNVATFFPSSFVYFSISVRSEVYSRVASGVEHCLRATCLG